MIAKKIPNTKKSSTKAARAGGLAEYITQPELTNKREKCISSEAVNFISTDLKSQTAEMVALSQEAVKSKDPIDHWVLSWKSNERPTPEQAREAAAIFIKQCGLEGHQYITGLHDDTENMHLHIAVNRVHPDTCKVVKINKGFDKEAAQQSIAIIEKVQGWSVETNARYRTNDKAELIIDPATKRPQIFTAAEKQQQPTTKAQAMEVQTGQKSAQRMGIEQAAPIIASATSWKELHASMAEAGMQYQRKGSGAVVQVGDELVKASNIDRKASLSALEKRFGPYQPPPEIKPNEYHHHTAKASLNTPQPLRENQPGWNEYVLIRDAQKAAKTHETIALQKRHSDERAALAAKLKAERAVIFAGNWQGKGEAKNALQSVVATQQAAAKLELSQQHKDERKALQASYKPLPIYKQWREQPQIVGMKVLPVIDQHITRDKQLTVSQTLRSLSHSVDARKHITYQLDRKNVFRDEGRTIAILDLNSDRGIAAALATAQQKFGPTLELTGSDAFKRKAVAVAVENNLTCKFSDMEMDKLREQLMRQKYQTEKQTTASQHIQTTREAPPLAPRHQTPEPAPQAPAQDQTQTERKAAALAEIHAMTAAAQSASHQHSYLRRAVPELATQDEHDQPMMGHVVAASPEFVSVQRGEKIKIYERRELDKNLVYDGIAIGTDKYAKGNQIEIKSNRAGEKRTVLTEERTQMQTEKKRGKGNGIGI